MIHSKNNRIGNTRIRPFVQSILHIMVLNELRYKNYFPSQDSSFITNDRPRLLQIVVENTLN
jgi:hypothetical protein